MRTSPFSRGASDEGDRCLHDSSSPRDRHCQEQGIQFRVIEAFSDVTPRRNDETLLVLRNRTEVGKNLSACLSFVPHRLARGPSRGATVRGRRLRRGAQPVRPDVLRRPAPVGVRRTKRSAAGTRQAKRAGCGGLWDDSEYLCPEPVRGLGNSNAQIAPRAPESRTSACGS